MQLCNCRNNCFEFIGSMALYPWKNKDYWIMVLICEHIVNQAFEYKRNQAQCIDSTKKNRKYYTV